MGVILTTSTPPLIKSKGWIISGLTFFFCCLSRISLSCSLSINLFSELFWLPLLLLLIALLVLLSPPALPWLVPFGEKNKFFNENLPFLGGTTFCFSDSYISTRDCRRIGPGDGGDVNMASLLGALVLLLPISSSISDTRGVDFDRHFFFFSVHLRGVSSTTGAVGYGTIFFLLAAFGGTAPGGSIDIGCPVNELSR